MTEIVGKILRRDLCSDCRTLVEAYQRAYLCDECAEEHDADEAVAVNSDKANLLVEGGSNGHGHADVQPDSTL